MYKPQKLHPLAYLGSVGNTLKNFWIPLAIFIFNFRGVENVMERPTLLFGGGAILLFILILFVIDVLQKYKTRFWIEDGKFIFKTGIFVLKEKELTINRIQSIDITEPLFLRIFGVCRLEITTPADGVTIEGIKLDQAEEIRRSVYKEKADEKEQVETEVSSNVTETNHLGTKEVTEADQISESEMRVVHKMSISELIIMAMTSGGLGIFLAGFITFINFFNLDTLLTSFVENNFQKFASTLAMVFIVLTVFVLVIGYIIGTVILIVRYFDYKVFEDNDDLIVQYGLIEKKRVTVNINRVQNIIIKDNILRRMFGFKSLYVTIIGDSDENVGDGKVLIVPLIKKHVLYEIIKEFFPNYTIEKPVHYVRPRAFRRYIQVPSFFILLIYGGVMYATHEYANSFVFWLVTLIGGIVLILQVVSGFYSARHTGYIIKDDEINILTTGFFVRTHYAVKLEKINTVEWFNNPFTRRAKLGTVDVITAGGKLSTIIRMRHLELEYIDEIWKFVEGGIIDEANIKTRNQILAHQE